MKSLILCCLVAFVVAAREPCEQSRARIQGMIDNSHGMLMDISKPTCDEDGSYSAVQCLPQDCYCADKAGKYLGYQVPRWQISIMNCKCARDKAEQKGVGVIRTCEENGNYAPIQCKGSMCYCADENGEPADANAALTPVADIGKLNC